jgi:hypothetical protein
VPGGAAAAAAEEEEGELAAILCSATDADDAAARRLLRATGANLDKAIDMFYAEQEAAATAAAAEQVGYIFDCHLGNLG